MATRVEYGRAAAATPQEAGGRAKGEFECSECGYGVVVHDSLPECPMCRGTTWEAVPWRPFTRRSAAGDGEDPRERLL